MDVLAQLSKAAEGLLFSSEADYPLELFVWEGPTLFSPSLLYQLTALPVSVEVTVDDVDRFFAPMLHLDPGADREAQDRAARFRALVRLLRRRLRNLAAYKLGRVEMPTFIVGQLADGRVAGLRTTVVET
ncbi:MAG: nuclease A inhibitor family protein [Chloroflexales bacterium]